MPELPEVETTVRGLKQKVLLRTFVGVWSDWGKMVKKPKSFKVFKKEIKNKKIIKIWRRAKNVIFDLSGEYSLLIHQKMTGHLLVGKWVKKGAKWCPESEGPLNDPYNRFIHFIFFLDNNDMMALSDARKFAKIELWETKKLNKELEKIGPEPLEKSFNFIKFKEIFKNKRGRIKQIIMDSNVIAGIGNIYAAEALWRAKIHPCKNVADLSEKELKLLHKAIIEVLNLGIKLGGESFSDYRKPDGSKGKFDKERKVYKKTEQQCQRCHNRIKRIVVASRGTFYCPICQRV